MNVENIKIKYWLVVVVFVFGLLVPFAGQAYSVKTFSNMTVENDFVLTPGKAEFFLNPGESTKKNIKITNRSGKVLNAKIIIEDFDGKSDGGIKLFGEERGPYSLRDYIKPERWEFQLAHGEEVTLPVVVEIPYGAEPGGLYGSVIVSVSSANGEGGEDTGTVATVSRLGALFFVRIKGDVDESGNLKSFNTSKKWYQHGPIEFAINYENTGNVHATPYAEIEIKNIAGKVIEKIEVDPWFVMPGFMRSRAVTWDKGLSVGRYVASLKLYRNYGNEVDEARVVFWIIPFKVILIALGVILVIAGLFTWLGTKFELKRKK